RHRLRRRRRLPAAAELLRASGGRRELRADRLHDRRARRHGELPGRAHRRLHHRRHRIAGRPLPRREPRQDRRVRDLHRDPAAAADRPLRSARVRSGAMPLAALLALLLPLPLVLASQYWLHFAIMTLYAALLGQAWNLLGGYGGQRSFGHAAFFGTGAYAAAILQLRLGLSPWLCLAAAAGFGAAAAALVAT